MLAVDLVLQMRWTHRHRARIYVKDLIDGDDGSS